MSWLPASYQFSSPLDYKCFKNQSIHSLHEGLWYLGYFFADILYFWNALSYLTSLQNFPKLWLFFFSITMIFHHNLCESCTRVWHLCRRPVRIISSWVWPLHASVGFVSTHFLFTCCKQLHPWESELAEFLFPSFFFFLSIFHTSFVVYFFCPGDSVGCDNASPSILSSSC